MPDYVLDHHNEGERERLALMSRLLDPMHRRYVEQLGIGAGARTLEVGCGNGTVSEWLARRVAPDGTAVAVDLDLSLVEADVPNLELRRGDIVAGPVAPGDFDLVSARAMLHHVADARTAVANLVASARPGGAILLIEPDFLPVSVAEPPRAGMDARSDRSVGCETEASGVSECGHGASALVCRCAEQVSGLGRGAQQVGSRRGAGLVLGLATAAAPGALRAEFTDTLGSDVESAQRVVSDLLSVQFRRWVPLSRCGRPREGFAGNRVSWLWTASVPTSVGRVPHAQPGSADRATAAPTSAYCRSNHHH